MLKEPKIKAPKKERKTQITEVNNRGAYIIGILLVVFVIVPGIIIALCIGNPDTILGMKKGAKILLIMFLVFLIGGLFTCIGMAISNAVNNNKQEVTIRIIEEIQQRTIYSTTMSAGQFMH